MQINVYPLAQMAQADIDKLMRRSETDIEELQASIRPIIDDVKTRGDAALVEYNNKFDPTVNMNAGQLKATPEEFAAARKTLDPEIQEVIKRSAKNIKKFHEAQMPEDIWFTQIDKGITAGEKVSPITSVALYVPRGKGAFPSVMLMLAIPAVIAKVPQIIVCTPPGPNGSVDDASLFAAEVCGVSEVYKVGGAQAIAAAAYGTDSVPKVNKVIGPGSSYVSAAKRILYGRIDVGTPAGPSESIILCDEHTDPKIAALDLLIEAEHGPDSCALLVTHSQALAEEVKALLPDLINELPEERQNYCTTVLSSYGGIVVTDSLQASYDFTNEFAPEHLEVLLKEPMSAIEKLNNVGEMLLGPYSPITIGNFSLGVNAILPTGGFAKTFSCVTVHDFLKRTSIGYVTAEGYADIKDTARKFAEYEGFASHARAIAKRPL
jgi:histidinol dehydrogenase